MPIIASQSYSSQAAPTSWNFRDGEYLSQSKKRSEMPQFCPNAYQQCQIRCDNREQFDFLIDILYNREAVQEFLKKHSADKIEEKYRRLTLHYITTFQPDVGNGEHIQQYNI